MRHTIEFALGNSIGGILIQHSLPRFFRLFRASQLDESMSEQTTDVGGVREMLEGWGELVRPRDPAALGAACVRLLRDGTRRATLGRRGRERVLSRFRAAMVADQYRDLYAALQAGRRAAA